jgi:hypothetical protein
MSNALPTHGREGVLLLSTDSGSTKSGTEVAYSEAWSWTPSKEQTEISKLNATSKEYLEGLVSGTLTASGSIVSGSAQQRIIFSRFAKVETSDTGGADTLAAGITDGNMWFHGIIKPIDTGGTSDDIIGQKIVVPILASGLSIDVSAGDVAKWSYDGQQNGDALYTESTSTAAGIPKKAV